METIEQKLLREIVDSNPTYAIQQIYRCAVCHQRLKWDEFEEICKNPECAIVKARDITGGDKRLRRIEFTDQTLYATLRNSDVISIPRKRLVDLNIAPCWRQDQIVTDTEWAECRVSNLGGHIYFMVPDICVYVSDLYLLRDPKTNFTVKMRLRGLTEIEKRLIECDDPGSIVVCPTGPNDDLIS